MRNDPRRDAAALKYLAWLQTYDPKLHAAVMERIPEQPSSGLGQTITDPWTGAPLNLDPWGAPAPSPAVPQAPETPWWQTVLDTVKDVGSAYLQWEAQKDILEVQKKRVEQGLPPIDTAVLAPTVRVQADIPAEFRAAIGGGIQNVLLWGAAGLAAFLLLRNL